MKNNYLLPTLSVIPTLSVMLSASGIALLIATTGWLPTTGLCLLLWGNNITTRRQMLTDIIRIMAARTLDKEGQRANNP